MKVEKMKGSRRWLSWLPKALLATLLAGALAFVGCKSDDDDDDPKPVPVDSISLDATSITLGLEGLSEVTLKATVTPDTATNKAVSWSVSGDNNSDIVEFTPDGVEATVKAKSIGGPVTITATALGDTSKTAQCVITVTGKVIPIDEIKIAAEDGKTSLTIDEELLLTATVDPEDATDKDKLKWTSSDLSIATVTENPDNPLEATLTAKAKGPVTITASAGGKESNKLTITVEEKTVGPISPAEKAKQLWEQDFEEVTNITDVVKTPQSGAAIISLGTDATNYLYAKHDGGSGPRYAVLNLPTPVTASVYCVEFDLYTIKGGDALKTTSPQGAQFSLSGTALNAMAVTDNYVFSLYNVSGPHGDVGEFSPTWYIGHDNTGTPLTLNIDTAYHFKLDVDTGAVYLTVSSSDTVVLPKTLIAEDMANTTLSAINMLTGRTNGEYKLDNIDIYVPVVPVTGVKIEQPEGGAKVSVDGTLRLSATISPASATNTEMTWKSENPNYATVDETTGIVTGKAVGTAKITVTTTDGEKTDSIDVEVTADKLAVTSVEIIDKPSDTEIGTNKPLKLTVQVKPSGAKQDVTWDSSNKDVATVEDGVVTCLAQGTTTITVTSDDNPQQKDEVTINVVPYKEDFESDLITADTNADTGIFTLLDGPSVSLETDSTRSSKYLKIVPSSGGKMSILKGFGTTAEKVGSSYVVEFDSMINANATDGNTMFALCDKDYITENVNDYQVDDRYLFKLGSSGKSSTTWVINGVYNTDTNVRRYENGVGTVALNTDTWYHFMVEVSLIDDSTTVTYTITESISGSAVNITPTDGSPAETLTVTLDNTNGFAEKFVTVNRHVTGLTCFDNIVVKALDTKE